MKYRIACETRAGGREYNEDRLGHWETPESALLVVADGMGGHAHGEVAAQLVVEHLGAEFERAARPRLQDPDVFLHRRITGAHALLGRAARARGYDEVPRTTVAACVVQAGRAYWIHVGDSRFYLLRGGKVLERTRDHTRVQKLLDEGHLDEDDMLVHPERNVLLQCLGGPVPPRVAPASSAPLERGDVVLLCSDGLWGPLPESDIARELRLGSLEGALVGLVERAARDAGRHADNVTALAFAWDDEAAANGGSDAPAARTAPEAERAAWAFPHVPDSDVRGVIEELRRALRRRGREAIDLELGVGDPAPEEEYLRMSDEEVEREIARLREAYRRAYPEAPAPASAGGADEEYLRMSDEDIERAIARIRVAFRALYPDVTAPGEESPGGSAQEEYLRMSDEDIEHAIEKIRVAFRRGAAP